MRWIDLHMHTSASSDGEYSPETLMSQCSEAGLKVVAVSEEAVLEQQIYTGLLKHMGWQERSLSDED